jgi:hypothetical protein
MRIPGPISDARRLRHRRASRAVSRARGPILAGRNGTVAAPAGAQQAITADATARLMDAAFARGFATPVAEADPIGALLDRDAGVSQWSSGQAVVAADGGAIDSLHLRTLEPSPLAGGRFAALRPGPVDPAYDLTLTRAWPSALSFQADRFGVDLSPHAGVGVGSAGGSAEAGAMLTIGPRLADPGLAQKLGGALGLRDAATYHGAGRWYVFAAASGRAVGLSLATRDPAAGWSRTQDQSSALIGDAQVGVGWRKGDVATSLGYVHRSIKGDHMLSGEPSQDDSMVAFSLSVRPGR